MHTSLRLHAIARVAAVAVAAVLVTAATVLPQTAARAADAVTAESVEVSIAQGTSISRELAVTPVGAEMILVAASEHGQFMGLNRFPPSFTYEPVADYVGTDSFQYRARDGDRLSEIATVTIHVFDPTPVVPDQEYSTHHLSPMTGNVLTDASDPAGKPLTASLESEPQWGHAIVNADGSFVYTPDSFTPSTFPGQDSFTVTATNGTETTAPVTVTIGLTDQAPTADPVSTVGTVDEPVSGSLSGSDPDGDPLVFEIATAPAYGDVALDGTDFTYTPDAGFAGDDSFTYIVHDGALESAPAMVDLTIAPPFNMPPVAMPGGRTGTSGLPVSGLLIGIDPDGDALVYAVASEPADGTVEVDAATGQYTYVSDTGFVGEDTFTFTVSDGTYVSPPAEMVITVLPYPNRPPSVEDAAVSGIMDSDIVGTFIGSDADGDDLAFEVSVAPEHGSVVIDGAEFTYTPDAGFTGQDSFLFVADDGEATSAPGTIDVIVNPLPNTAPVAHDVAVSGDEGTTITGTLTGTDDDGDALTYALASEPASGTVTLDGAEFAYTPNPGFTGDDAFAFTAGDGQATSEPATVTITVNAVTVTPTPPPTTDPTPTPTPPTPSTTPSDLAVTGADPTLPIVIGAGLLVLGAIVLLLRRRGRRSGDSEER